MKNTEFKNILITTFQITEKENEDDKNICRIHNQEKHVLEKLKQRAWS